MHEHDEILSAEIKMNSELTKANAYREEAMRLFMQQQKLIEQAVKCEIKAEEMRIELEVLKLKNKKGS